jgi:hypothetical protein
LNPSPFIAGIFESLTITCTFHGRKTRVCNIYNPPGGTNKEFLNQIKALNMFKDVDNIICGDFNIDALKPENTDVKMTFAELGLGPQIDQATRTKFKSATLLDQIYCSNRKLSGFILETDISDHFTVGLFHDKIFKYRENF